MTIKRTPRALGALFVAIVLALVVAGCGGGIPGNSVASVAGNPITTQAFNHWMYVAEMGNAEQSPGSPVIVPTDPPNFTGCIKQVRAQIPSLAKTPDKEIKSDCAQLFTSLSSQVMDFLIKAYWYQADAYKDGIHLSQKQINQAFAQAKKQQFTSNSEFQSFLKESGQTQADIVFRVRVNKIYSLLMKRLQKKVTPAAISAYYKAHQSEFSTPETRNLRIVRTSSSAKIQAAKKALQSGQSWASVAKQYSVDASTKNNGGVLNGVASGQEEAALNKVAFSAPLNKLEGPVHGTFGWYLVEVTKITPGTHQSLKSATSLIKQLLTSQYQTSAENKVNSISKKNWGSQTQCRSEYSMNDCSGYKAPKTTSTAASATPTTTAPASAGTATAPASSATATTSTASSSKKKK